MLASLSVSIFGKGTKLVYRHYATLYFVFAVDNQESELGILDLIQGCLLFFCWYKSNSLSVFVETLDKSFENVCELDLIFHSDKVFINFVFCFLLTNFHRFTS